MMSICIVTTHGVFPPNIVHIFSVSIYVEYFRICKTRIYQSNVIFRIPRDVITEMNYSWVFLGVIYNLVQNTIPTKFRMKNVGYLLLVLM